MASRILSSVIIPALNEGHYLPGLLASLGELLQDPQVEVIVVDAGSHDDTVGVAERFGCRVIRNPLKVRPATARNQGVSTCKGQVLVFLDADVEVMQSWIPAFRRLIAYPE